MPEFKWYVANSANNAGQGLVCDEVTGDNIAITYDETNAKLIAAAPEMLRALLECEVLLREYPVIERQVKEVVRKALGED